MGLRQEVVQHLGGEGRLRGVVQGVHFVDLDPHFVGVVVADAAGEPRPPEDDAGPVPGAGLDQQGDAGVGQAVQVRHKGAGVGDAAGPAVGDHQVLVHGAQVAPQGHVAGLQVHAQPRHFDGAPAGVVLVDVVAQDGQVAGVAAGAQADADGVHHAGDAPGGQGVQIGGAGRLQGGEPPQLLDGPVAQAVHDDEHGFVHKFPLWRNLNESRMSRGRLKDENSLSGRCPHRPEGKFSKRFLFKIDKKLNRDHKIIG